MNPRIQSRILRYMARRDHSLKEIELKLKKFYTPSETKEALQWAQEQYWMPDASKLSDANARRLHAKHKGIHAINAYLQSKGLPLQASNPQQEIEKALQLATKKYSRVLTWSREHDGKAARFLASRGFEGSVISQTLTSLKAQQSQDLDEE